MLDNLAPRTDEPAWVKCWRTAREVDDYRYFAEQIPALAEAELLIPPTDFSEKETWVQIGEYGYEGCLYDFNAPVENNRLCAMHPHAVTNQPLHRTLVGGLAFMLCLDCETRYKAREKERFAAVGS